MVNRYCTILLDPATKAEILAACIQAEATLQAGERQAAAASQAGWATLLAGVFALIAGVLAYRASTAQNRAAENQRIAREDAYAAQICAISSRARDELVAVFLEFIKIEKGEKAFDLEGLYFTSIQLLRDELAPSNWERHALLGFDHLNQLTITYESVQALIVEVEKLLRIRLPTLGIDSSVAVAEYAKVQCEALMTAIAARAPNAMQESLKPVMLLSANLSVHKKAS